MLPLHHTEARRLQEVSSDLQRTLLAEKPACVVMTDIEAALASAWIAQIGSKSVTVTGVPAHVASGVLPLSCVQEYPLHTLNPQASPFQSGFGLQIFPSALSLLSLFRRHLLMTRL